MNASQEDRGSLKLRDHFYRDSLNKVLIILLGAFSIVLIIVLLTIYFFLSKPLPVVFPVSVKWQVQAEVGLNVPFLNDVEITQWVNDVMPELFDVDFLSYDAEVNSRAKFFTAKGFEVYQNHLKNFAPKDMVVSKKWFVNSSITSTPVLVDKGMLLGRYAWIMTEPVKFDYIGTDAPPKRNVIFKLQLVRVPTTTNLSGVAIDNLIVTHAD